ncbi:hypothetical protein R5N98_15350 [Tenacibaculum maritimum]|uniref:Lipoprotein n=1 Tax=Tenacibaculum maritimum NCIMB 2154 TaxID=1349785 RepID=A0A2H1EBJ9_9FLAO|nr:hypothetical protein [Tenacibaculum maritimum]SFZ83182.1 conserved protein of unknown function [Tenacibaculum maritimum NCIMB 2154]
MGINKILKSLIIFLFALFIVACKQKVKKENATDVVATQKAEVKKEETAQIEEQVSQNNPINLVRGFYTSYLTEINNATFNYNLNKYLSQDLIKYINRIDDGNLIIDAQDYEIFDLNTLKVSTTQKDDVFKVQFINMGHETVIYARVKSVDGGYKIVNLDSNFEKANIDIVFSELKTHEYTYYKLIYYIKPSEEPRIGITYTLEDFDENNVVFRKSSYDEEFAYLCAKKVTENGLKLYYKEPLDYEAYTGDTSKSLITIYKKGDDFYATSPLIEDGKEIKLKEEE